MGSVGDTELQRGAHTESSPSSESKADTVSSHSKASTTFSSFAVEAFRHKAFNLHLMGYDEFSGGDLISRQQAGE